jgi:hypothetical protein
MDIASDRKGSFTALLSLPQCHAALSTIPYDLASVDKSLLYYPHAYYSTSWCGWQGYVLERHVNVHLCSCFYYWRIITECRSKDSCRDLFKNLKILPLLSHYLTSHLLSVVNNTNKFKLNSGVYNINTGKNMTFINLYQIYHYIKKESAEMA